MGVMTNDMERLRGEVDALRLERGALMQDLALGTKQRRDAVTMMRTGFRKTRGEMARKAKNTRAVFVTDLAAAALKMIAGFHKSRTAMAKRARAERLRTVADLRQAVAADLAGAHRFWCGPFAAEPRARRPALDARRLPIQAERKAGDTAPVHPRPRAEARVSVKEEPLKPKSGHSKTEAGPTRNRKLY